MLAKLTKQWTLFEQFLSMNDCAPISKESAIKTEARICNILVKIYAALCWRVQQPFLKNRKTSLKVSKSQKYWSRIARSQGKIMLLIIIWLKMRAAEKENQLISKGCSTCFRWLWRIGWRYYNVNDRSCLGCGWAYLRTNIALPDSFYHSQLPSTDFAFCLSSEECWWVCRKIYQLMTSDEDGLLSTPRQS